MADSHPNSDGGEGDQGGYSSASASGTTEGLGGGAVSPHYGEEQMETGEAAPSPVRRARTGSSTSSSSNAEDMDNQDNSGEEAEALRIEDLVVPDSVAESQGQPDRGNRGETGSRDSSVHSHKDDKDPSQKEKSVGEDAQSTPTTPQSSTDSSRKKKKLRKRKSNAGGKQRETVASREARDASSSSRPQPSAQNLARFFEAPFTQDVLLSLIHI